MNKWVLLVSTCAVLLGFAQEMAQATCESGEESLLLQTMSSSKDPHASCLKDINMTQTAWKELILAISESYPDGDYVKIAKDGIDKLYGYDIGTVMFKPTKAPVDQFRPTSEGALSYFVGYDAISPAGYPEDGGFAINNGEGWKEVVIKNYDISCMGDLAIAQGYYFFTNAQTDKCDRGRVHLGVQEDGRRPIEDRCPPLLSAVLSASFQFDAGREGSGESGGE